MCTLLTSRSLDAQHFLFCNHYNYTIHPQVIIFEGMKVAEVGTGTGYVCIALLLALLT